MERFLKQGDMIKKKYNLFIPKAFSLIEVVVVMAILVLFSSAMLQLYVSLDETTHISTGKLSAVRAADIIISEMKTLNNSEIVSNYSSGGTPGEMIQLSELNGYAQIDIDSSNMDLIDVKIYLHWKDRFGRLFGEDADLDGVLDIGEDLNGNGILDSVFKAGSLIAQK